MFKYISKPLSSFHSKVQWSMIEGQWSLIGRLPASLQSAHADFFFLKSALQRFLLLKVPHARFFDVPSHCQSGLMAHCRAADIDQEIAIFGPEVMKHPNHSKILFDISRCGSTFIEVFLMRVFDRWIFFVSSQ